ncbi:MAG: spore cortex biosynthesis protein YabQ [Clostridia bacterium]|nr:spore cortex biosynthesis protein YabQ [Clostridia bacterium]
MYHSASGDMIFFLAALLAGAAIAFLYDLIRISRRIVSVGTSAVGVQDIVFFVAAAMILFYAAYTKNSGEIRWQGFIGSILGAGLYAFLVRNRFVNLGTTFLKWLIKSALAVFKLIAFPVRILLRAIRKPVEIIAWYTGAGLKRAKRITKCGGARVRMRALSALSLLKKK